MYSELNDPRSILQVIGCILLNPDLLDEHPLEREDFEVEAFHEIVFASIYNLYQSGIQKIDDFAIDQFLSSYPNQYKIFNDNKGLEWLNDAIGFCEPENFMYYYKRLKKMSYLRYLNRMGVDTAFLYNPKIIEPEKLEKENAKFDAMDLEAMIDQVETRLITNAKLKFSSNGEHQGQLAGKGMRALKESFKQEPEFGLNFMDPITTTVARGARKKKFYLYSGSTGSGKAIPNDTVIPTPSGFKKVGEIRPGDYLFNRKGKPTKVLAIYPQPEKKQVYEITFGDGRIARCCEEHLWSYKLTGKDNRLHTKSLKEILDDIGNDVSNLKKGKAYKYKVPVSKAVEYPEKELPIPPYVLGVMLGDASFRYTSTQKTIYLSSEDNWLPKKISEIMGWRYKKNSPHNYNYSFEYFPETQIDVSHKNVWVEDILNKYPELWNTYSHEKFIPQEYLEGSVTQRYELLRGLLDTDGSVDEKGRVSFATTSPKMRDGFQSLCRSLGLISSCRVDTRSKYKNGEAYDLSIQCSAEEKSKLFYLPKHLEKIAQYVQSADSKRKFKHEYVPIVNIRALDEWTEMTCFTVDNEEQLFLMNDFIVTHNTRMTISSLCAISIPWIYDFDMHSWVYTGMAEPGLFISTELEFSELQTIIQAYVSGVPEDHIIDGKYGPGEEERVDQAIAYIESSPLYLEWMPDFAMSDVENVIKKYKRMHDVSYVVFDYIHTSAKLITEIGSSANGMRLREDQCLFLLSDKLKNLCNTLDIFILSGTQLNEGWKTAAEKDSTILRGAKSLADRIDLGVIFLEPSKTEMEAIKPILARQVGMPIPNRISHVYKCRRGKYTRVKLWHYVDLSTCRMQTLFVTDHDFKIIPIQATKVVTEEVEKLLDEHSVAAKEITCTKEEQQAAVQAMFDF